MGVKEWTTQYPTNLDTTTQMPTLANESSLGAGDGDDTRVSQIHALRDSIIQLETLVGTDSLETSSLRYRVLYPTWNYLDLNMPTGMTTAPEILYQFDGTANTYNDRSGNGHTLTLTTGYEIYQPMYGVLGHQFNGSTYLDTVSSAAYRFKNKTTIELVTCAFAVCASTEYILDCGHATTNSESKNDLYSIRLATTAANQITFYTEHGAGTDEITVFDAGITPANMEYLVITRDVAGTTIKVYQNGTFIDTQSLTLATGGTDTFFRVGGHASGNGYRGIIFSIRITGDEFSAAQVLEAYRRVRGIY